MRKVLFTGIVPGLALALAPAVQAAGGHYAVDDAAQVDSGRCQIETWYARAGAGSEDYTLVPACNPTGNLELGLGLSRLREAGERDTVAEVAAKTLLRELEPGGYGVGLAASTTWGGAMERHEGAVGYGILSVHLIDNLLMHYNLGWAYERDADNAFVWGIGGDYALSSRVHLIAETYGTHRGGTELQAGLRYAVGPAAVDLSYGRARADRGDDWVTAGFAWAF